MDLLFIFSTSVRKERKKNPILITISISKYFTLCFQCLEFIIFLFLANYGLPEDETDAVIPMFKEVTFTELDREEAVKVIELYNKVAKEKGYGKKHEDRKLKKFKSGNQRPGNFKGNQNNRG